MKWSDEDILFLKNNYYQGTKYCSIYLNRSRNSVKLKANKLGLNTDEFNNNTQKNILGSIFGRLTVLQLSHSKNRKRYWICKCECGNLTKVITQYLRNGKIKSCGCYNIEQASKRFRSNLISQKFGRLLVVEYGYSKNKLVYWKCLCECGKFSHVCTQSLQNGDTKSCGNCQLKRNGYNTSYIALNLHKILSNKGIHNFKTKFGPIVDIALVKNGYKIAIEYDEWYWHNNKLDKDQQRVDKLIKNGWKVLTIRASKELPNYEDLINNINELAYSEVNHIVLTLPNWKINNDKSIYSTN